MPKCSKCGKSITSATMVCDECMPRWIPVTESLPYVCEDCLVAVKSYNLSGETVYLVSMANYENGFYMYAGKLEEVEEITHWMPLPEPPKEVQK